MASRRCPDLQSRPTEFLDFTRVPRAEFQPLVPPFAAAYQAPLAAWRLEGKPRPAGARWTSPGRSRRRQSAGSAC